MYTLYWSPGTASLCVHWMLIELGEPHELVKVDIEAGEHRKPEYLKLNPGGVIPTLVVEGKPLGEAGQFLDRSFPRFADDLAWWTEAAKAQRLRKKPPY